MEYPAFRRVNEELKIFPYHIVDIRDGEIRFPPNTSEYGVLRSRIITLMNQSDLTDEDKERIKGIAREIYEMVKTNTPTSAFQITPEEEEAQKEWLRQRREGHEQRQEQIRQENCLRERASQALGDNVQYAQATKRMASVGAEIAERTERYEREFVAKYADHDWADGREKEDAHRDFTFEMRQQEEHQSLLREHSGLAQKRAAMEDAVMEQLRANETVTIPPNQNEEE